MGGDGAGVTAVSRTEGGRHEWVVLGTASAAFSHTVRGTKFHGLQFKAEGQE